MMGTLPSQSTLSFKQAIAYAIECLERAILSDSLCRHRGNRRAVSRELGLSYRSVLTKISRYGLEVVGLSHAPKIDVTQLLPSAADRALLLEDFERGNMDLIAIAGDYGLSVEACKAIITSEQKRIATEGERE